MGKLKIVIVFILFVSSIAGAQYGPAVKVDVISILPQKYESAVPTARNFERLPDGRSLSNIFVRGSQLTLSKGTGEPFSSSQFAEYRELKKATQTDPNHPVQWVFMNLDTHEVIDQSLSADRKLFGASSSKVYVAAALLDKQNGRLSDSQLQLMSDMLVVSSNEAWTNLQSQIGDGDSNKGRELIMKFTKKMGYEKTRGFQGKLGDVHGNELTASEAAQFLYDTYHNQFPGAEIEWKIMHACRTGVGRGRKYIPSSIYVGGKTGTYDGPTENPQTGKLYEVAVRNHLLVFNIDGFQLGLAILANSGTNESAALLAGGLIREHTSVK